MTYTWKTTSAERKDAKNHNAIATVTHDCGLHSACTGCRLGTSMRPIALLALFAVLLLGLAVFLLRAPDTFDEPQPVPLGETEVQKIRGDDGNVEVWTYTKEELSETAESDSGTIDIERPTGAAHLLNEQALNAWNSGDIRTALDLFEEAIAADPNDSEPLSNYGRRLTIMVAHDQALPLLLRASELSPDDPQVWLDLLTLYERAQQFQKANDARQRARTLAGDRELVRNEQGAWLLAGASLP